MNYIKKEIKFASNDITLEFNKYSKQANSSVMVTSGGTQVLVTVCVDYKNSGKNNFFPLTVDYIEKFYASGRIPGGFIKRETKPGNSEILIARSLDRPLRPCFPKEFNAETQIVATVLSYDDQNDPASLSLIGASSCLMISDIPFDGPLCYLNLGYLEDKYILNPSSDLNLDLNLTIAAKPQGVVMVEANANFISEEKILECIEYAHKEMKPVFEAQLELKEEFGKDKIDLKEFSNSAQVLDKSEFSDFILDDLKDAYKILNKSDRNLAIAKIRKKITKHFNRDEDHKIDIEIDNLFDEIKSDLIRNKIFDENIRLDGRKFDDIRNISCETSVLKRPHGSGLFTRGETQSLAVITLGSEMDQQEIDSMTVKKLFKKLFFCITISPLLV
jgi:polyribonucleotide nucleotidyltransferase